MKRITAALIAVLMLSGCGQAYSKANGTERKTIDGVECVVVTSQSGSVAVDCNWSE